MRAIKVKTEINRKSKIWYVNGVNINYSFKTLEALAKDMGADVEAGDYLIIDNANGDKRKAYKKTANGSIIVYASLKAGRAFTNLGNGLLGDNKPLIDWFSL